MSCENTTNPYIKILNKTCHSFELQRHASKDKWLIAAGSAYSLPLPYSDNCDTLYRLVRAHCSPIKDLCHCKDLKKHDRGCHHRKHKRDKHKKHHNDDNHVLTFWININGEVCRAVGGRHKCDTQFLIRRSVSQAQYQYNFNQNNYNYNYANGVNGYSYGLNGYNYLCGLCPDLSGNIICLY